MSVTEVKSPFIKQLEPSVSRKIGEKTRFLNFFLLTKKSYLLTELFIV